MITCRGMVFAWKANVATTQLSSFFKVDWGYNCFEDLIWLLVDGLIPNRLIRAYYRMGINVMDILKEEESLVEKPFLEKSIDESDVIYESLSIPPTILSFMFLFVKKMTLFILSLYYIVLNSLFLFEGILWSWNLCRFDFFLTWWVM